MNVFRAFALGCVAAAMSFTAHANDIGTAARNFVESKFADVLSAAEVISAIEAQNAKNDGISQGDIDALDKAWRAGDRSLIDAVLSNGLSHYLSGVVERSGGAFSEVFVMDAHGLNVGQSAPTSDYWQGDEDKWTETFGKGLVHVSDVEEDESTQTFQVQVSLPIIRDGKAIGAITFGIDVAALE